MCTRAITRTGNAADAAIAKLALVAVLEVGRTRPGSKEPLHDHPPTHGAPGRVHLGTLARMEAPALPPCGWRRCREPHVLADFAFAIPCLLRHSDPVLALDLEPFGFLLKALSFALEPFA